MAINIAAEVLIITCPCALGLAVPAVVTAASGRLFRRGMLIKSGTALERLAEADTVVFDKTGTLTLGQPEPQGLEAHDRSTLALVAGLARGSAHPLSRALAESISALEIEPAQLADLRETPGCGTEAHYHGRRVRLGRADWVGASPGAHTATWLALEGATPVPFAFTDQMRPGAQAAVAGLRAAGLRVALVSGDTAPAVEAFAARLGIDDWTAAALPEDKSARIAAEAAAGHKVLMVGDGLNDTAALAGAHVSISPASALDAARVASDIVLLGQDLTSLPEAVTTARRSVKRIRENFALATLYNVVAVPLAVAGLATPLVAALAMSASSLTVTLNALRLR